MEKPKIKWDNIRKEYYVAEEINGRVIIRKPTLEEMEESGWRSSFNEE